MKKKYLPYLFRYTNPHTMKKEYKLCFGWTSEEAKSKVLNWIKQYYKSPKYPTSLILNETIT